MELFEHANQIVACPISLFVQNASLHAPMKPLTWKSPKTTGLNVTSIIWSVQIIVDKPLGCPFHCKSCNVSLTTYAGCEEKVQRQEMQSHVESSVKAHLQMVARHAKIQEKKIEALTAQVHLLVTALQCSSNRSLEIFVPYLIWCSFLPCIHNGQL